MNHTQRCAKVNDSELCIVVTKEKPSNFTRNVSELFRTLNGNICMSLCEQRRRVTKTMRIVTLERFLNSLYIARTAFGTHGIPEIPHQNKSFLNR